MKSGAGAPTVDDCPVTKGTQQPLCPIVSAQSEYAADGERSAVVLVASVCSYATRQVDLHFSTTLQTDYVVRDAQGVEVWRWSAEHPAQEDDVVIALAPSDCWEWRTGWRRKAARSCRSAGA
jgi:hypothetical protein